MQDSYPDHPYKKYEGSALWIALDEAIARLESNSDVTLTTARQYVIGHLCDAVEAIQTGQHRSGVES